MQWKLFSVLPGLLLAQAALATDPLYQNYAVLNYNIPGNLPPQIDAIAFDNESVFNVNFFEYSCNPAFYETWNTVNYTNNGLMTANAPGLGCAFGTASGAGFQFDKQTTNQIPRTMAGTFYNPGTVRCDSFLDGNDTFIFLGTESFSVATIGECIVSATNIVSPGTIEVGVNSLIQLNGQNVDLTRGTLLVEPLQSLFLGNSVGVYSIAAGFGADTNQDWNPGADLTPTTAYSSLPYIIDLTNSTPYFDFRFPATNLTVIRSVFVQNTSLNVPYHVYIEPNLNGSSVVFAPGAAHVEWVGTVNDPATCSTTTNYLYLTDDYVLGASTNVFIYNGTPDNFTFVTSTSPLLANPVAAGFDNIFPDVAITNPYSFFDGQVIVTTTPTNATPTNPGGALTNLPGRIQITASNELNLGLAIISGQNYMSLWAPKQFDGSVGAQIAAPYSDINLGVTNGFLVITNLLESALPNWSGFVAAWSTRWLTTVSNTLDGTNFFTVTNDYRVLIVRSSQLMPVTAPQVQNLRLHATNSLLITDVLNVFGSLFIDAQNLTLTTNGCGNGATSLDGELNLVSSAILWQSALPNVRNLTNNGAIRTKNLAVFGGPPPANYTNFINHGLISDQGSIIYANNFLSSGIISNGVGSFLLEPLTTTLINGSLIAGGDVSITTGSLLVSNLMLQAGRALTLQVTNFLTDGGVTNGNIWVVGSSGVGGSDSGFNLPILPNLGDLLGTTITNIAPTNKSIINVWAGRDFGVSVNGYTNNVAVGRLFLDALSAPPHSLFTFNGAGASNAMYVDYLELRDQATNRDASGSNFTAITIAPNMVIYYAQAVIDGLSIAEKMNHKNGDHLRWVPEYAGYFSSTNLVYPDGTTNGPFNAALAQSFDIDSDGDGIANGSDPTPFFVSGEINFKLTVTNKPPLTALLTWDSIPSATNTVDYRTNLVLGNWLPLTTNISPSLVPPAGGWPITNIVADPVTGSSRYYRVRVDPNSASVYGP